MSDPVPPPEPSQPSAGPGPSSPHAAEVEVDLAAFLPDGVVVGEPDPEPAPAAAAPGGSEVDLAALDQVEADLDAVDAAIAALDAGTYGTDPATGALLDDRLLAEDPTRRS